MSSYDESEREINTPSPKTNKTAPKSDKENVAEKKITTKTMIQKAIIELTKNKRKGASVQAIKKYIADNFDVDVERNKTYINKGLKSGVEAGIFVQTKGIGASGSFRMAAKQKTEKEKVKKTKTDGAEKQKTKKKHTTEEMKKIVEKKAVKVKEATKTQKKENSTKNEEKELKVKKMTKDGKMVKSTKMAKDSKTEKGSKIQNPKESDGSETPKTKKSKFPLTAAEKRAKMMKRKSIGSIIKPPKMKPKHKA